jgi:hypothetical protein
MTTENPESPLRALLEASANSPLAEADPSSLDELMARVRTTFNTKPLDLTDDDIAANVKYFRLQKHKFAALSREKAEKDASAPKRSRKSSASSISEALERAVNEIEL